MNEYTIYALRTHEDWAPNIFESLEQGEGQFGWNYADLRELRRRIQDDGWKTLSAEEKDCYQGFLLDLKEGDYVVYINVPAYGKCTLARVTGEYFWKYTEDDFNHRIPVDPETVMTFDRNDQIVHPTLRRRLKLQGKYWRIYLKEEFNELVRSLQSGDGGTPAAPQGDLARLAQEIQPALHEMTRKIQGAFPGAALEGLLASVFQKVPGVLDVKHLGGPYDHGADLLVDFVEPGLPIPGLQEEQRKLVVQVKSYEGGMDSTQAVDDVRRAFEQYGADMGLIVSTAERVSPEFGQALEALRAETEKPVGLLVGPEVARFVLRFGSDLIDLDQNL